MALFQSPFSFKYSFVARFVILSRFTARNAFKTKTFKQSTFKCNQIENFLAILHETNFEKLDTYTETQSCNYNYYDTKTKLSLLRIFK